MLIVVVASLTLSPPAHPPIPFIVVSSSISLFRDLILSVRFVQPWFSVLPWVSEAFWLQAPTFSPIFCRLEEFLKHTPISSPFQQCDHSTQMEQPRNI